MDAGSILVDGQSLFPRCIKKWRSIGNYRRYPTGWRSIAREAWDSHVSNTLGRNVLPGFMSRSPGIFRNVGDSTGQPIFRKGDRESRVAKLDGSRAGRGRG